MGKIEEAIEDIRLESLKCKEECLEEINKTFKIENPKIFNKDIISIINGYLNSNLSKDD